jgi:hypothetical protein
MSYCLRRCGSLGLTVSLYSSAAEGIAAKGDDSWRVTWSFEAKKPS